MSQAISASKSRVSRIKSVARSALADGLTSHKSLWLGPAITVVLILAVGYWAHLSVEGAVKKNLAGQLQTLLDADVAALEFWMEQQRADTVALAKNKQVRAAVIELAKITEQSASDTLTTSLLPSQSLRDLRDRLQPALESNDVHGFTVINSNAVILAGDRDFGIGDASVAISFREALAPVFDGETVILPPFKSVLAFEDIDGTVRAGISVMFVAAPVKSDGDGTIAALCLRIRPEEHFTEILRVARAGESGETYAFNKDGLLVTNSRFDNDLKLIGLLPDDDSTRSLLNVQIRNPGVDMTKGERPAVRRNDQPLTKMAMAAISGDAGVDVDGYRDYRGVPVVGAWTWLPQYSIGVATEIDVAEAFRPLYSLRLAFGVLAGLLVAVTLGLGGLTYYATQLDLQARRAVLEARRLGQYALGDKIGEGGMGIVYHAHHDMMHRPAAVKLLSVEKSNEKAIGRFEREVQLTCQLTHPNTIAIYDYGRTPEGIFYYAMEYLDGISLEALVTQFGPLPEGRVIFILRQLCGSLSEAHDLGLIHRDVKPANVMLTQRGGMCDFVKLLDFGLVKPQDADQNMTLAGSLTGTPLYLSPEAVLHKELDARSDLYAVGAIGYFLLTGTPVFQGRNILEICNQHASVAPDSPSERLGRPICADLEQLILSCLAKQPDDRPFEAEDLENKLGKCTSVESWSWGDAKTWWAENLSGTAATKETVTSTATNQTVVMPPALGQSSSRPHS